MNRREFLVTGAAAVAAGCATVDGGKSCAGCRALKPRKPGLKIVAVQPEESPILDGGAPGPQPAYTSTPHHLTKHGLHGHALIDSIFAVCSSFAKADSFSCFRTADITFNMEMFDASETSCAGNRSSLRKV